MPTDINPFGGKTRGWNMTTEFNKKMNPCYPIGDEVYRAEIDKQQAVDNGGREALLAMTPYKSGGGSVFESPWGTNQSIDAGGATSETVAKYLISNSLSFGALLNPTGAVSDAEPLEFCTKGLVVKPGNQLSLQRHRGREEYWIVKSGTLTVIVDGHRIDVGAGQGIFIPKGSTHCMNNNTDEPVHVEELQFGICREADNVRLLDATRDTDGNPKPRPTFPIKNDAEYRSAILFAQLAIEIAEKRKLPKDERLVQFATLQPA